MSERDALAALDVLRAAFESEIHTPNAILHRIHQMGYDIAAVPAPALDAERLARALCTYAGERQRLAFPLSRVRTVAHRLADIYYLDPIAAYAKDEPEIPHGNFFPETTTQAQLAKDEPMERTHE